jgi:hypothetical protein
MRLIATPSITVAFYSVGELFARRPDERVSTWTM